MLRKFLKSYTFNVLIIVLISALVFWLVFYDQGSSIIETLKQVTPGWILFIFIMSFLVQFLAGASLTILTKFSNPKYSFSNGFICAMIASFFSGITPSSTGGQVAQVYVFNKQGVKISESASVLWLDFLLYQVSLCVVVFFLFLFKFNYFYSNYSQFFLLALIAYFFNIFVVVALVLFVKFPKIYYTLANRIFNIGHKIKLIKDPIESLARLNEELDRFSLEINRVKSKQKEILYAFLVHVIRLLLYYSIPFYSLISLGVEPSFSLFFNCLALASFVSMMNAFIPIPGASGGTEVTFMLMFSTIVGELYSKSSMIIWRFSTFYLVLIAGAVCFIYIKLKKKKEY